MHQELGIHEEQSGLSKIKIIFHHFSYQQVLVKF